MAGQLYTPNTLRLSAIRFLLLDPTLGSTYQRNLRIHPQTSSPSKGSKVRFPFFDCLRSIQCQEAIVDGVISNSFVLLLQPSQRGRHERPSTWVLFRRVQPHLGSLCVLSNLELSNARCCITYNVGYQWCIGGFESYKIWCYFYSFGFENIRFKGTRRSSPNPPKQLCTIYNVLWLPFWLISVSLVLYYYPDFKKSSFRGTFWRWTCLLFLLYLSILAVPTTQLIVTTRWINLILGQGSLMNTWKNSRQKRSCHRYAHCIFLGLFGFEENHSCWVVTYFVWSSPIVDVIKIWMFLT